MEHYTLYEQNEMPEILRLCMQTQPVLRLQQIGMNCGCEYTDFPRFRNLKPYSRYDHSIGVALIVWHFTGDRKQALSGLFHDIATPVFAHVVDFMHGDYLQQESTEAGTREIIEGSKEICSLLMQNGISVDEVSDYHRYPVADNDSPKLSADRLEYTIGNILNYKICDLDAVRRFYEDLMVECNELGEEELMFRSPEIAEQFALAALGCSRIYVADEDRYAMQMLAELLREAMRRQVISEADLYSTEPEVIARLSSNPETLSLWKMYCAYRKMRTADHPLDDGYWRKVTAKKRFINPMVWKKGRVSDISDSFSKELVEFKNSSQDYWMCGSV